MGEQLLKLAHSIQAQIVDSAVSGTGPEPTLNAFLGGREL